MKTILVTGCSGKLGSLLFKKLINENKYKVIGVDCRSSKESLFQDQFIKVDLRKKRLKEVFENNQIDSIYHLNINHNPRVNQYERYDFNIRGTNHLLELACEYKVKKLLFLSSADVYGAGAIHDQLISEEAPLLGSSDFSAIKDLVDVDMLVASMFWKNPKLQIVILRACHIIGPFVNTMMNYLKLKYPVKIMGFDPLIQLIHFEDLLQILINALDKKYVGIFNIKGPGEISIERLFDLLGKNVIPLPEFMVKKMLSPLWFAHLISYPAQEVNFLKYPCMVSDDKFQKIAPFYYNYTMDKIINFLKK